MARKSFKNLPAPEPEPEVEAPPVVKEPEIITGITDRISTENPSASAPVKPTYVFNGNKDPKAMNVLHVRTTSPAQIGALGSSLDAKRNSLEMELRPDLGGVLVSTNILNGKEREFLVPFANIAHIELEVVCVNA